MVGCALNTNVHFIAEPSSSNFAAPEVGVPLPLQERASQINSHVTVPCLLDIVNLAFKVPAAIT